MNVWRWLGLFLFLAAVTCFTSTRLPVYAGGKDKDKKEETKDKDKKGDDKDKKGDDKKGDDKKAEAGQFKAFNEKSGPFYQDVTTETTQLMKVMGQEVKQVQKQTFFIKWTPQAKDKDQNYQVVQEIIGVKMNIDIGGNIIAFDSTADKQPQNPMTDFFKALMKQKLTFVVSPKLEVIKIDGRDEFIKALSETNPAIKTLLETIMSKDALASMAKPTWWAVPREGTKTWEEPSDLDLGPIGKYATMFKFTNEGPDAASKADKIKIEAELKYTKPGEKAGGLPFVIKDATLSGKGSGFALFNRDKGRIDQSELKMKLEGELTIEVGNMSTIIKLNQDQTSTTKTFDTDPLAKK